MAKKEEKTVEQHHTGSVVPEDEELTKWLNKLWARNEPPERVEVWQLFGKEKRDRGEMIFHEDFSPERNKKFDVEQANRLANEIIATAQNDCEATPKRREAYFQIAVIDKNRRAVPLTRRLGPLRPQRHLAIVRDGESAEADLDEEELGIRHLEHNRYKTGLEDLRWHSNRNDRVLGELLLLFRDVNQEQREETRSLRAENRELRQQIAEAEDRRVQREMMLEEKRFTIGLKKEALRVGRNLIPGLFSEAREPQAITQNGHSNGQAQQEQPQFGPSTERQLVDNFLHDCEEEEGLMEKLTGDFEEQDGKLVMIKPGIFSPKQVRVLVGVRGGYLHPDELDKIMPESGHPLEITMQQISQAMEAGITEGMGIALMELKAVRTRAREKREAAAEAAKNTNNATNAPTATT